MTASAVPATAWEKPIAGKAHMPLARIITRFPEDAHALVVDLRTRGYEVETAAPDQIPETPAELKIFLEECEAATALDRADESPASEDLCVFVAPGAITDRVVPIQTIRLDVTAEEPPSVTAVLLEAALKPLTPAETVEEASPVSAVVAKVPAEIPVAAAPVIPTLPPPPEIHVEPAAALPPALKSWPAKRNRSDVHFWRIATITGVLAVGTILLGGSVHRPISGPGLPAESVLPAPALEAVPPATAARQDPKPLAVPKPVAAKASPRHVTYNRESDLVAKDFVIHYRKQAPAPRLQAQKKPGVKYYSDLK